MGHHFTEPNVTAVSDSTGSTAAHRRQILTYAGLTALLIALLLILLFQV